jgi:hypothetical protein
MTWTPETTQQSKGAIMTTITLTTEYPNRQLAYEALNPYRDAMRDFIMQGLRSIQRENPQDLITKSLPPDMATKYSNKINNIKPESQIEGTFDEAHFPHIVKEYWSVFEKLLVNNHDNRGDFKSLLFYIKTYRNINTAHVSEVKRDINIKPAKIMVETIAKALRTIKAESAAATVDKVLQEITSQNQELNNRTPEQDYKGNIGEVAARAKEPTRTPWRDAIEPHRDIIDGVLEPHQFAANLQEVYDGRAEDTVYGNPVMFFRHTYLTEGITNLLKEALRRLAGKGSHPIIQAQTGFGGGKTHSLIALYHMVNSGSIIGDTSEDAEDQENRIRIREILRDSVQGLDQELKPAVSVLHGTYLSPTDGNTTTSGDPLDTLWGVMAYQLAGQAGYEIIGQAARTGSAPGGQQLQALFKLAGPSLILMDEIVNYARNLNEGQIDRLYSFFQTLTDAIPATENVVMVVALPASERELGDTRGVEITRRLEAILGRVQSVWRPVEDREGFEVIRRRLFQDATCDPEARDATCEEFRKLYQRNNVRKDLPDEARSEDYIQRIKASYPIHPEIFDRIHDDWSTYAGFQRTRGALRMMALFIHHLYYSDNNTNSLIMPGDLPFHHNEVSGEFLSLLGENWNPVVAEVDSDKSRVRAIDARKESSRQSEIAQRIARTIFFGSIPERQAPGLNDRQIRLGVFTPGLQLSDFHNTLKSIEDQLLYVYKDDGRLYFSSEINVNRAFDHRRSKFNNEDDDSEITNRLRDLCSDDRIIVCPETAEDVPDEPVTRTVILGPEYVRDYSKDTASPQAEVITTYCGEEQPRRFPNALLFNAMHGARQNNLRSIARNILGCVDIQ